MEKVLILKLNNLIDSYDEFESLVSQGVNEFSFVLDEEIEKLNMEDLNKYMAFLQLVSDIIVEEFKNSSKQIEVDVLTQLFTLTNGTFPDDSGAYLICNNCPCYHCKQDPELFERVTMSRYLPPWQFCKKATIEMNIARQIAEELQLPMPISDLELEDIHLIARASYGNNLALYKQTYKTKKEGCQ